MRGDVINAAIGLHDLKISGFFGAACGGLRFQIAAQRFGAIELLLRRRRA
jgi:hypothetical protein